jgi:hypothetical protein
MSRIVLRAARFAPCMIAAHFRRSAKMKNRTIKAAAALAVLIIAGCASAPPSAEERRAKVPEFSFSSLHVSPGAYHVPDAKWTSDVQSQIVKYTGGGLVPALVGAAIDNHNLSEQQRKFEEAQAPLLPILNEKASSPPSAAVEKAVIDTVTANSFLAQKVRSTSARTLEIRLIRFGLAKKNKQDEGDPEMAAQVLVDLTIRSGDTVLLRLGGYSGSSADGVPISALAKNPDLITKLYHQAAESLGSTIANFLKRKYDE